MRDKKKPGKSDKAKGGRKKAKQAAPEEVTVAGFIDEVQEAGAKLAAAANSPIGREAIAVGLTIAAAAAQAAIIARRHSGTAQSGAKTEPDAPAPGAKVAGQDALGAALSGVAETLLTRFLPVKKT